MTDHSHSRRQASHSAIRHNRLKSIVRRKRVAGLRRLCIIFGLASLIVLFQASVYCEELSDLDRFLSDLEKHRSELKDFQAEFTQIKHLTLFDEMEESRGTMSYRNTGEMIWVYESPERMTLLVQPQSVSYYFPRLEQIEVYRLNQKHSVSGLFLGFDSSVDRIKEAYEISLLPMKGESGYQVSLVPQTDELLRYFTLVILWLREGDFAPHKIRIEESDGDSTSIVFRDIRINSSLDDSTFDLKAPEGTEVIDVSGETFF